MALTIKKAAPADNLQMSANGGYVIGIDVSTDTGVVVLGWDVKLMAWRTVADFEINLPSLPKTATVKQRMLRLDILGSKVGSLMKEYPPKVVAIEGYGYANAHSLVTLVELGTVVRGEVLFAPVETPGFERHFLEVAPAQLKKFILGKGVGKKEQVMMQVFKRYGYEAQTNNLADAFVLAQIAAACFFVGPHVPVLTKPQQEVVAQIKAKNT